MKCKDLKINSEPNVDYINNIILNEFTSYSAMRALECFLTQQVHSKGKKGAIFPVVSPCWKQPGKHIGEGTYGSVDLCTIFKKSLLVVKTTKRKSTYKHTKEEYELGINAINTLRYQCPNFCYTFCAFTDPVSGPSICYEYIGSRSLASFLGGTACTVEVFFCILIQLLAALEIGQKECRFGHYDLGIDNIMIRDTKINYSVNIDNNTIEYTSVYCPVIIDYGFATAQIGEKKYSPFTSIFSNGDYGKYNYLIQGFDMFYILADIYSYSKNVDVSKFVKDILDTFYGTTPYNFNRIKGRDSQYWGLISKDIKATFTPGSMLKNLIRKYPSYLNNIKVLDRTTYELNSLAVPLYFRDITSINLDLSECFRTCNSYLVYKYYSNREPEDKYAMLDNDRRLMAKYKDIVIPRDAVDQSNRILSYVLRDKPASFNLDFIEDIKVYMDMYYMIRQIQPREKIYIDFLNSFRGSDIFKFYVTNGPLVFAAKRWLVTLLSKR